MTVVLHDYWRSTASYRVRIVLNLAGVEYQARSVDLLAGEQRSAEHLALNPQGFVPVLEIDGLRLTQSPSIIEYLDETCALSLLQGDAATRARLRQTAHVIAMDTHPICTPMVVTRAAAGANPSKLARTRWMQHFIARGLRACEQLLSASVPRFSFAAHPTLADLCIAPQLYNARRWKVGLDGFPRLRSITAACAAHPGFSAASPDAAKGRRPARP